MTENPMDAPIFTVDPVVLDYCERHGVTPPTKEDLFLSALAGNRIDPDYYRLQIAAHMEPLQDLPVTASYLPGVVL